VAWTAVSFFKGGVHDGIEQRFFRAAMGVVATQATAAIRFYTLVHFYKRSILYIMTLFAEMFCLFLQHTGILGAMVLVTLRAILHRWFMRKTFRPVLTCFLVAFKAERRL
jgi:hypothetical protein